MSAVTLTNIQTQMNYYAYPVVMVFGIIGNLFILILFNRQRHNACSIYLVNSTVTNLLYLISEYSLRRLLTAYNNGSIGALILCKVSTSVPGFLGQVTKTILILACIDRYIITSHRVVLRAFSTPKQAKYLVFFSYIFCTVTTSHQVIFFTISNGQCTRVGIYATIYTFYAILFIGLIPSIMLSIFACLTYRNLKHLRSRIQPINRSVGNTNQIIQRRDRDLICLVIAEVILYIITTTLFPLVLLEMMISQYVLLTKSVHYSQTESFAFDVALFLFYILSAAPFYTYMVSSASFRRDFKEWMVAVYRNLRKRPLDRRTLRTRQARIRCDTHV